MALAAVFAGGLLSLGSTSAASAEPTTVSGYDIDTASSLTVVVNKTRPLTPLTYAPAKFGADNLAKPASDALSKMRKAMSKAGSGNLLLSSGYRGYYSQKAIYRKDVANLGLSRGQKLAAKPGYSEHQTGLAADLAAAGQGCAIRICFEKTKAGIWLAANSWRFGFILRYPRGATAVTGYQFEPWHFRFVGVQLAGEMHDVGEKVLENYLGLPPAPTY
jgi:D-alanyl-D-alanine carboxypeptidase